MIRHLNRTGNLHLIKLFRLFGSQRVRKWERERERECHRSFCSSKDPATTVVASSTDSKTMKQFGLLNGRFARSLDRCYMAAWHCAVCPRTFWRERSLCSTESVRPSVGLFRRSLWRTLSERDRTNQSVSGRERERERAIYNISSFWKNMVRAFCNALNPLLSPAILLAHLGRPHWHSDLAHSLA